jgi:sec-independent protein translocase protein TatA
MGAMSLTHWIILLVVVVLIFGTKKLANVGKDLGQAVKGFKDGVASGSEPQAKLEADPAADAQNSVHKEQSKV